MRQPLDRTRLQRLGAASVRFVFMGTLALASAACGSLDAEPAPAVPAQESAPAPTAPSTDGPGQDTRALCAPVPGAAPVRIAIFQDKSRSTNWTRTEQITVASIRELVSIVCRGAGSIAVGPIADDSNRTLTRLYIPRMPAPPREERVPDDPFEGQEMRERNRLKREAYEREVRSWRARVEPDIERFLAEAAAVLERAANAPATDVATALERSAVYFAEPNAASGAEVRKYLILVTDGEETAHKRSAPSDLPARVLLVNGAGRLGILARYNPTRFEAVRAAIDYISDSETAQQSEK